MYLRLQMTRHRICHTHRLNWIGASTTLSESKPADRNAPRKDSTTEKDAYLARSISSERSNAEGLSRSGQNIAAYSCCLSSERVDDARRR